MKVLTGTPAAPGITLGPIYFVRRPRVHRRTIDAHEVKDEIARLEEAMKRTVGSLGDAARRAEAAGADQGVGIFETHAELVRDPEFAAEAQRRIRSLDTAETAVRTAAEQFAAELAALDDPYLAGRADDIRDIAQQLIAILAGVSGSRPIRPSIIVAHDLSPADMAAIPEGIALGFVSARGAATSHVAMLARSFELPAVVGLGSALDEAVNAAQAGIDGDDGRVLLDPDPAARRALQEENAKRAADARESATFGAVRITTRTGRSVDVFANIGSVPEADAAIRSGADGIGLFRTEFLFMGRASLPSEDEQFDAYRIVAERFAPRPVVIRTLDVGGDKQLPGVDAPAEDNPFLGWRGIRMSLDMREMFRVQLAALIRASAYGNVRVLLPMIVDPTEVLAAKEILARIAADLDIANSTPVDVGAMIETPAAAILAEEIARQVSFVSIGTNDLTQYVLAADRGHPALGRLQDQTHPAVLRAVEMTCRAAASANIPVAVCGEAAADVRLVPRLLGMGVTELSVTPQAVAVVKRTAWEWSRS